MNVVSNLLRQNYAQAMSTLEQLDHAFDKYRERVLGDLRDLKEGAVTLDQLTVTDNDYEIMPEKPTILRKEDAG